MNNERSAAINIGDKEYELVLTTRATKAIAGRYGGLENLGEKLMKSENFEMALDEIVWLITLLANQSILIRNLKNKNAPEELLTEEEVELLTSFGVLNYSGMLFNKGNTRTPLSAIIGSRAKTTNHVEFITGQEYTSGGGEQPAISENASLTAPEATVVTREQKTNVTQIFMEAVGVSYAKQSNMGTLSGVNIASQQANPINELDFQVAAKIQKVNRDIEYTFINGAYNKATTDAITIHCIVGQWTAKQGCDYFATTDRDCSSNYIVGKDGSIGLSVEEKDRSWCSSSSSNDHRAITIEVASDTTHPYAITAQAYAALIDLVTDICKRNNIKELKWKADKSLIGQVDKQNMTVHRWFAAKACPGEYLYERHSAIAAEVNKRLGTVVKPPVVVTPTQPTPTVDVAKTIWDFFIGKGLNACAVAGLMGNLYAESALKPTNLQNTYEQKLGLSDSAYTQAVDNGSYTNFVKDFAGYGLAQWTYWSRKQALLQYAQKVKKSIGDLTMQLEFLWQELQSYTSVIKTLRAATSIQVASDAVLTGYERPANQSDAVKVKRAGYGKKYYDQYASSTAKPTTPTASVPYLVKVDASVLNIRKQPTTSSAITGSIKDKGVYTIIEEASGAGATRWGKLKSGAGWISLDYAKRV